MRSCMPLYISKTVTTRYCHSTATAMWTVVLSRNFGGDFARTGTKTDISLFLKYREGIAGNRRCTPSSCLPHLRE